MASIITIAGEKLFAQKAQANEQLDIDTFIFANVPGQDPAAPIDRDEAMPDIGQQVHQQIVQQVGRINENVVVYSTVLDSVTGDFDFNWVGLYSSVNDTLVAINHIPTTPKTATAAGVAGNTLNRNFGIEYSGIADLTGITVAPETWQLDFTARLSGMDELTRNLAKDLNGTDSFIDDGFKVVPRETVNSFSVLPGIGYVNGLRIALTDEAILNADSYPKFIYVDAYFDGEASSVWKPKHLLSITSEELTDYIDETGKQHYVVKLANITTADEVEDLRLLADDKKTKAVIFETVNEAINYKGLKVGQRVEIIERDKALFDVVEGDAENSNGFSKIASKKDNVALSLRYNSQKTSKQFGVVCNGVNDDSDAFEHGSNFTAILGLKLNHEAGIIKIQRDVTIKGAINQEGYGGWTPYNSGTVIDHGNYKVNVIGNEPQFKLLIFKGASELAGTNVHCETSNPDTDQNVDAKFIKCLFFNAYYSVSMIGRGITFEECGFSLFRRSLKVDWPLGFVEPVLLEQSLKYGMRGYNFFDCQWHASNGAIIENTGYNKDNFRGVTITGYPDTELSIIDGSIKDFYIDLNLLFGSKTLFDIGSTHKAINGKVTGVYTGIKDPNNKDSGFANILAMKNDSEIDNVEFDMVCRDVRGSAFVLAGIVGDITIKGTYKDICKQNDSSVSQATRYFIQNFGATINGKVKLDGNISIEDFNDNPQYLVHGLTDEEFEQGHVTCPKHIKLFGGNCRGRFGNISRHKYTGDGTSKRLIALPAAAQYVLVCGAQPNASQGFSGIATPAEYGGTGDTVMVDDKTLSVSDDLNTDGSVYIYVVHY